jgi:hypothetical protein
MDSSTWGGLKLVLALAIWLFLTLYFRKRSERRLAAGWKAVPNAWSWSPKLQELAGACLYGSVGIWLNHSLHMRADALMGIGLLLAVVANIKQWLPLTKAARHCKQHTTKASTIAELSPGLPCLCKV